MTLRLTLALAALLASAAANAADYRAEAGSTLGFRASYDGEGFEGRFGKFSPAIRFDPADLAQSRFDVRIDLASAGTANADRDEMLLGPDFFDDTRAPALPAGIGHAGNGFGVPMEQSILELVRDQARRLQSMGDELDTVRASLNERKTVERAKGLLMAHRQLSEEQAHKTMRQMAMNQNKRLIDVAEAVLAMADVLPGRLR